MSNKKEISMTERVVKNSVWQFLLTALTKGGGLVFTVILARLLLPESFGLYSLTLSIAILFMSLGNLGLNQAFTVFYSKMLPRGKNEANAHFNYLFRLKFSFQLIISVALFFGAGHIAKYYNIPELSILLMISSLYIFFFSVSSFFASFYYIYKKVKIDLYKEFLFQASRLILIILVFVYFSKDFLLTGIFLSLLISSFIMMVFTIFTARSFAPFLFSKSKVKVDKKRIWKFLTYIILSGAFWIIFSEIDVLMLGKISGDLATIGFYKASMALVLGVAGIFTIAPIMLPIFSSFKERRVENAAHKVMKYTFLLSIPASFGILVLGRHLLRAIYGYGYIEAALIVSFLAFLIFSESTANLFNALLSSREKPKFIMYSLLVSTIINIILNYALITYFLKVSFLWAAAGAAIATLVSRYIFMFSMVHYSRKELKITIDPHSLIKPAFASLIMAGILFYITKNVDMTLFIGLELILLGALIYLFVMILIKGIIKEDFQIIKFIIPNFLKKKKA